MSDFFSPENISEYVAFFQRHMFMSGIFVVVLGMLIYTQFRLMTVRIKKLTVAAATVKVNREDGVFVDIRAQNAFSQGHIANSVNVPAADIKAGKVNLIEKNKELPVILVGRDKFDGDCYNCTKALKKRGFTDLFVLEGGVAQWSNDNLPLSTKR